MGQLFNGLCGSRLIAVVSRAFHGILLFIEFFDVTNDTRSAPCLLSFNKPKYLRRHACQRTSRYGRSLDLITRYNLGNSTTIGMPGLSFIECDLRNCRACYNFRRTCTHRIFNERTALACCLARAM